jgi:DtxR family Mn-dependent transcriptional regulator
MDSTESREEYLEAILRLEEAHGGATVTRIAQELGVRPASVSQMTARLVDAGLVRRDQEGNHLVLTGEGRTEAIRLVRLHRLSERFLTDYLGLPWDVVHEQACRLEHVLSDTVEESLVLKLGRPLTCPHGQLIPYDTERLVPGPAESLVDVPAGGSCLVVCVADESPDLLRYVGSCGLQPGARVTVTEVAPFDGPLALLVEGTCVHVGREVARKVLVSIAATDVGR